MSSNSMVLTSSDRNIVWNACMQECEDYLNITDCNRIIKEVYSEIPSPTSNVDLESSSPGFLNVQMDAT